MGTFVETIMFYLIRQWGLGDSMAIERPLSEYGRAEITHNVEFTFHPVLRTFEPVRLPSGTAPTARNMARALGLADAYPLTNNRLVAKDVVQNACVVGMDEQTMLLSAADSADPDGMTFHACLLDKHAYAMVECKRVGKEGNVKGPQTIEKAKQGAYVARTTSST